MRNGKMEYDSTYVGCPGLDVVASGDRMKRKKLILNSKPLDRVDVYVQVSEKVYALIPNGIVASTKISTNNDEGIKYTVEIDGPVEYLDMPDSIYVELWHDFLDND